MIPFKLQQRDHKNHPKEGLYGVIQNGGMYSGYPLTIVDDSEQVVDGYYTDKPSLVLIHLAEGIRTYDRKKVGEEFGYLGFWNPKQEPTYRMFDYTKRELTKEEIIETLKRIVYDVEPQLHTRTCVGWRSRLLQDDPNRYTGSYLLNNEEEYKIEKCRNTIKFYKSMCYHSVTAGEKHELLYEGELNFEVYEKAVEVYNLRRKLIIYTNELLDSGLGEKVQAYEKARKELDEKLKKI